MKYYLKTKKLSTTYLCNIYLYISSNWWKFIKCSDIQLFILAHFNVKHLPNQDKCEKSNHIWIKYSSFICGYPKCLERTVTSLWVLLMCLCTLEVLCDLFLSETIGIWNFHFLKNNLFNFEVGKQVSLHFNEVQNFIGPICFCQILRNFI